MLALGKLEGGGTLGNRTDRPESGVLPPRRVGALPQSISVGLLAATVLAACSRGGDQAILPVVLGIDENVAPLYEDDQTSIYQVTTPVELPLRQPTAEEAAALGAQAPYPRAPFQLSGDTRITVRFTLTNLDDEQRTVELLVDPWNEFVRYRPGLSAGEEDSMTPNVSGIDRWFVIPPKSRIEGILPPDDFLELATDLGIAMNIAAQPVAEGDFAGPGLYNRTFHQQNRSSEPDLLLDRYRPASSAGIVGFDLGLRTGTRAKIAVELVIDVEDIHGDRVIPVDNPDDLQPIGVPGTILEPPAAPREM